MGGGDDVKAIVFEKMNHWRWHVTVAIEHRAKVADLLGGMEQISIVRSAAKQREVTFAINLSKRCVSVDLVDAEKRIRDFVEALAGRS